LAFIFYTYILLFFLDFVNFLGLLNI